MRSFSHWTPRYVLARCREIANSKLNRQDPWLTRESVGLLGRLLRPTDTMLEFGSGRSTLWFADRVAHITSVEHDQDWIRRVEAMAAAGQRTNITLRHHPRDAGDQEGALSPYVRTLEDFPEGSLDVVLVDGIYRDHCALGAIPKVRPGGMIIIDNVNWYLPSSSHSPSSRAPAAGPDGTVWGEVAERIRDWRQIWTTSGVTDTTILFRN